ncbi:hypothetical protein BC829DRAFT_492770 [Chytridium lagenaria]|nr:hypothetical protein BC829DRAFT_492770 [Chytridium lagenaria]
MGCCASRKRESSTPSDEVNEQTSLLHSTGTNDPVEIIPQNNTVITQQREQETLKKIVKTTAENLIDISSIRLLDKIQPEHAVERAKEYRHAWSQCTSLHRRIFPRPLSNITEALSKPGTVQDDDIRQASDVLLQVRIALEEVKVQEVGEVVVAL